MQFPQHITKLFNVLLLSLLTSYTSAQTTQDAAVELVDKEAVVGDWSCTEAVEFMGYDATSQMQWSFQQDQQHTQKTVSTLKNAVESAQFEYEVKARWRLNDTLLILDQYAVKKFTTDNPVLEAKVNLKAALSDPEPMELKVKTLTANQMVLNLMIFDMEVEQFSIVCKR